MENPIISIVVPLYNCERFIPRLTESLIPQLSEEVELILVDDGSTDKTPQMCDELALGNSYISVVHKKNGGLSTARNAGISAAKGCYISFVDGDDIMEKEAYQKILCVIKKYQPDMIDFGFTYVGVDSEGKNKHYIEKNKLLDRKYIEDIIIPPMINVKEDKAHHIFPFAWLRVIKSKMLKKNKIWFDETRRIWEDQPFVVTCLKYATTYYSMDEYLYRYIGEYGSLSSKYTIDSFNIVLQNYNLYKELFGEEYNFENLYAYDYWSNAIHEKVFIALEKDVDFDKNRLAIDKVLLSVEMQNWVKNSSKNTSFLKAISKAIILSDLEKAYKLYRKEYKKRKRESFIQKIRNILFRIRRGLKKNG